jgi:hypothetical protein
MNSAALTLTFHISRDEPAATLEAVLAIARRGGVHLSAMRFADLVHDRHAILTLASDEPDRLDLFLARLHNLIGVSDINCDKGLSGSFTVPLADETGLCVSG